MTRIGNRKSGTAPFSKRPDGRIRRSERRAAIARKLGFLNS